MQFIMGFLIGFIFGLISILGTDNTASIGKERFARGDLACKDHGGLRAWDHWENFTCNNGVVISNFKEGVINDPRTN